MPHLRRSSFNSLLLFLCLIPAGCAPGNFQGNPTNAGSNVSLVASPGTNLNLFASATIQLSATSGGVPEPMVWQIQGNGAGVVNSSGVYQAPPVAPNANVVTILGTSQSHPNSTVAVVVTITNPVPAIARANPSTVLSNTPFTGTVDGTFFVPGSVVVVNGAAVPTSFIATNQLSFSAPAISGGAETISVQVVSPSPGGGSSQPLALPFLKTIVSQYAATRFLKQASWGPTPASVAAVQLMGFSAYIDQQMALPIDTVSDPEGDTNHVYLALWNNGLYKPSQLRQRMMWMWFKLFNPPGMSVATWLSQIPELLQRDAFANFTTLLSDASLNTVIGYNLSSCCANDAGVSPNQNYARELMQLFSIGPSSLNQDGTVVLQADGTPQPAYTQADVAEVSRALTGWNRSPTVDTDPEGLTHLVTKPWRSSHDWGPKTVLGTTIAGGGDTLADLSAIVPLLANNPNTAPFMSQRIIRAFVTSNPSPGYVSRVAAVWYDDGAGVSGNLAAVIKAVLLDPEARAGDDPLAAGGSISGRVMDVVEYQMEVNRLLATSSQVLWWSQVNACEMNECSFNAPSVFGYFPAAYTLPGSNTVAPELSLFTASALQTKATYLTEIIYPTTLTNITVDWSPWTSLAVGDGSALVDAINQACLAGSMSPGLRAVLLQAFSEVPPDAADSQAKRLMYLTMMSPEFAVIR